MVEDPFIKHICEVADKTEVVSAYQMTNPIFGPVNCRILSGGCKNCILAYKLDRVIDADLMGDNCAPILVEIGKMKDLTVILNHCMDFSSVPEFDAIILNSNQKISNYDEYLDAVADFL